MKRSTFLLFILIGLVIFESSCSEQERVEKEYTLIGIEDTKWMEYHRSTEPLYRHDSLKLFVQFEVLETIIGGNKTDNFGAYALSISPNYPENELDSILVFNNGIDVTNNFSLFHQEIDLKRLWNSSMKNGYGYGSRTEMYLSLGIQKWDQEVSDTFIFDIKCYDNQGNIFEVQTEPVFITGK